MKSEDSFSQINELIRHFSELRDWDQFHTPKNLILAATSEMGELAEVLQWKSDDEVIEYLSSQSGKDRISEEIADVAIYLIRLCQKSDIDFIEAIRSKLSINESRYPAEKSKGKSKKYNELDKL
jgi:dCTP diphosphatase